MNVNPLKMAAPKLNTRVLFWNGRMWKALKKNRKYRAYAGMDFAYNKYGRV
jgi:hypothetical protein